jgi:RNA polymerase sigma-70 factor, ECF subfamily
MDQQEFLMADDAELAKRAASGDRDAAGEIYDRYAPLVRAILLDATGSLQEANELVQEVFLRGLTRIGQLRDPKLLCGWIVAIARSQGRDYRRRMAKQRIRFEPLVDEIPQPVGSSCSDEADWIREAVRDLPERERCAIHIYYLHGESAEIARQVLGLSLSAFHKVLDRARGRLRTRLMKMEQKR